MRVYRNPSTARGTFTFRLSAEERATIQAGADALRAFQLAKFGMTPDPESHAGLGDYVLRAALLTAQGHAALKPGLGRKTSRHGTRSK